MQEQEQKQKQKQKREKDKEKEGGREKAQEYEKRWLGSVRREEGREEISGKGGVRSKRAREGSLREGRDGGRVTMSWGLLLLLLLRRLLLILLRLLVLLLLLLVLRRRGFPRRW